jgi:hypothetical protein
MFRILRILFVIGFMNSTYAEQNLPPAITTPIPIDQLKDYAHYSPTLKKLILAARDLSEKNLTYQFGSADPKNKGMDCSGTIYYLLKKADVADVPRSSHEMFEWVKKSGYFHPVTRYAFSSPEFSQLKPGDLLFWSGTYQHGKGNVAISHVMLYLGENNKNEPLMFGSSDGRSYHGKKMWGVSVFDFQLPDSRTKAKFVGYSCIPNLTCHD